MISGAVVTISNTKVNHVRTSSIVPKITFGELMSFPCG